MTKTYRAKAAYGETFTDALLGVDQCLATLAGYEQAATGGTYVAEQAARRLALAALLAERLPVEPARARASRAWTVWGAAAGATIVLWLIGGITGAGWMPWPAYILAPWGAALLVVDLLPRRRFRRRPTAGTDSVEGVIIRHG